MAPSILIRPTYAAWVVTPGSSAAIAIKSKRFITFPSKSTLTKSPVSANKSEILAFGIFKKLLQARSQGGRNFFQPARVNQTHVNQIAQVDAILVAE